MKYSVKRLLTEDGDLVGYHLYSESGSLLLVADVITSAGGGHREQVRFVRPDGTMLATMSLATEQPDTPSSIPQDYVIIQDYAVYAIVTRRLRAKTDENPTPALFYTMEAEGSNWLILPAEDEPGDYYLYGQASWGARSFDSQVDRELPPQVGRIFPATGEAYQFEVELSSRRWRQTSLVILALVFLLDTTSDS